MGLFKKTSNADDDNRFEKAQENFGNYIAGKGYNVSDPFDNAVDAALYAEQQQREAGTYPPKRRG
ncbi:hypothetical protein ACFC1B_27265 [Streptomyces xiamenensis]|uniref:hypothetical protein n=1 Tax=Streptomyces xiamenensis TaxID=408015 RepID=UPI0035DC3040